MTTPDRRTALRELLAAIDEGHPAPQEIRFRDDLGTMFVQFDSAADLDAWTDTLHLGDRLQQPLPLYGDYEKWTTHDHSTTPWHGWNVSVTAYEPITDEQARGWVDSGQAAQAAEYDRRQQAANGGEQP